jgi:uncharacterized protein (TIGR03437 family)
MGRFARAVCQLLLACFPIAALAQFDGTPVVVIGWNPNDPANNADGHPALLTRLGIVWNAIIGPDGLIVFAEGSRIRRIGADGLVHTLGTDSRMTNFTKLAENRLGNIYYITETEIYKLAPDGSSVKIAGGGTALAQPGLAATNSLIFPQGLAVDSSGNLLFSDQQTYHVWRIDSAGILRVVAGTGTAGTAGVGGPASSAQLTFPMDLGFDAAGNLYIHDENRVLKIAPDGTLAQVNPAAKPINGAVATFDTAGNTYFSGPQPFQVSRLNLDGSVALVAGTGDLGTSNGCGSAANPAVGDARTATFQQIAGLALDSAGNLIVAEQGTMSRIRQVSPSGVVRTLAGGPPSFSGDGGPASSAVLSAPRGLAYGPDGSLYIADTGNNRIRQVTPAGIIQTVAGQDAPTADMTYSCSASGSTNLRAPEAVAVDAQGNAYIADTGNNRVLKLTPARTITTFAGTGSAIPLNQPRAVGVDSAGSVWIGDNAERTLKLTPAGAIANVLPRLRTRSFSTDQQHNLYLTSGYFAYLVTAGDQLVTVAGSGIGPTISPSGNPPVELDDVPDDESRGSGITRDSQGTYYNIGPSGLDLISTGCTAASLGIPQSPWYVAEAPQGDVYLADASSNVIWKLPHLAATASASVSTPLLSPGAPVKNAASMVVTSFDTAVPTGSNSTAVIRTLKSDAIAPGELIRIYGQCLGPFQPLAAAYDSAGKLPSSLGGVQLQIGGTAAPIVAVQEGMIVAVTPFGLSPTQPAPAVLTFNGGRVAFSLDNAPFRPGLFRYLELDGSETVLAVNQDGSINSQSHPAPVGSVVAFYATGLGQTTPPAVDGKSASDITATYLSDVHVTLNGAASQVQYAGIAPSFVGLSQINVVVPQVQSGVAPVAIQIGNAPFRQVVSVWVR